MVLVEVVGLKPGDGVMAVVIGLGPRDGVMVVAVGAGRALLVMVVLVGLGLRWRCIPPSLHPSVFSQRRSDVTCLRSSRCI